VSLHISRPLEFLVPNLKVHQDWQYPEPNLDLSVQEHIREVECRSLIHLHVQASHRQPRKFECPVQTQGRYAKLKIHLDRAKPDGRAEKAFGLITVAELIAVRDQCEKRVEPVGRWG
jgi:hypothetical protein